MILRSGPETLKKALTALALAAALIPSAYADTSTCFSTNCTTAVTIPLTKTNSFASDLVYAEDGQSEVLTPDEAEALEEKGVDLSTLNPDPTTNIWKEIDPTSMAAALVNGNAIDQTLPIQSGDTVTFVGINEVANGRFKFNVQGASGNAPSQPLTLIAAKDLHTYLLKKEILRMLGYQIPAMKYLPKVSIRFPDSATETIFLTTMASDLIGQITRWQVPAAAGADPLVVTLQDLIAVDSSTASPNVTFGAPILSGSPLPAETSRILRALPLVYGLAGINESLNETTWNVGQVQNGSFDLTVPMIGNFSCSLDDALWMLRRIGSLTRENFVQAVAGSAYPDAIGQLVVEKLVARRNSLMDDFKSVLGTAIADLPDNIDLNVSPSIANGKVTQQTWPGYASQFAYTDVQSPLRDIWYYPLSLLESNVIENLLNLANSKLPALTQQNDITAHSNALLNKAAAQYASTGQAQKLAFGAWSGPLLSGSFNISRDVVIGNYMGTNNMISLADTFGVNASAGIYVGFDGVPANFSLSGVVQGTATVNFTHLTPLDKNLDGLKEALQVPLQNIFVAWLFSNEAKVAQDIANINSTPNQTPAQMKTTLQNDMTLLGKYLATGESLILTESLTGNANLTLDASDPIPISPTASLTGGANEMVISRIRLFRSSDTQLSVFVDGGQLSGLSLTFNASIGSQYSFPIISIGGSTTGGNTTSKIFSLNIDPDPQSNPQVYQNALALSSIFGSGTIDTLESQQQPAVVSTDFSDSSGSFSFLFFQARSLTQSGKIHLTLPSGYPINGQPLQSPLDADFIALGDGTQSGNNFQAFLTSIGAYITQLLTKDGNATVDTQASADPGQTFYGSSTTRDVTFQARLMPDITQPVVQIEHRWEGWSLSANDAQNLNNQLSKQYGFKLFNDGFLTDAKAIQIYNLSLKIYVYEAGIKSIMAIDPKLERELVHAYRDLDGCSSDSLQQEVPGMCSAIDMFDSAFTSYNKGITDTTAKSKAMVQAISGLEQFLDFHDFTLMFSDPQHQLYVAATLNGIREATENQSTSINSNTYGTNNGPGVLTQVEGILGIDDGEMDAQWIRNWL